MGIEIAFRRRVTQRNSIGRQRSARLCGRRLGRSRRSVRKPDSVVDADAEATVDKDDLAGEEAGPLRGEEADKLCDLLGLADPLHWDWSQKLGSRRVR